MDRESVTRTMAHGEFERLRSRRTLLAAEEGDPVLFTEAGRDRAKPLKVTDVGGNEEDGYYIVVEGPRGGKYTLEEHRGRLRTKKSNKSVTNLRFADVADDVEASYREMREGMLNQTYEMMASDSYDYDEFAVAATDAAQEAVSSLPEDDLRVILMAAPENAGDTEAYAYSPHDDDIRSVAYAILADELAERGSEYANSDLSSSIDSKNDVASLVDKGLVMADNYVEADAADDFDEAAEAAAMTLCDRLSTSDHQAVIDFLPRPERSLRERLAFDVGELVPWGDRATAYERATAFLTAGIIEEKAEREKARLKSDKQTSTFVEWVADHFGVEPEEMFEEGFSVGTPPEGLKLPVLADGGMPHTTLDEATKVHLRDVPVATGGWGLLDAGLVTDGEQRRMVWANSEAEEMVVMASVGSGNENEWRAWALDIEADTTTELYAGTAFNDALDAVKDYITPDDGDPKMVVVGGAQDTLVTENVDEEVLGERVLTQSGIVIGGAADAFSAILPYAEQAGGLFKTVGIGIGKATGSAASNVGGAFWRRYRRQVGEFLLATVGTALLHNGAKVLGGARFTPVLDSDALGFEGEYREGAVIVDEQGNTPLKNMDVVEYDLSGSHAGEYRLLNRDTGRSMWAAPGETSSFAKVRKVVNPHDVHIGDGSTLAWGIDYEEIVDFGKKFGTDIAAFTLGSGQGMGQTWKPSPTGSSGPSKPSPWSKRNRGGGGGGGGGGSSSSSSDRQRERERKRRQREEEGDVSRLGISDDEWSRMWDEGSKLLNANASGLMDKLDVGMSPSEAAAAMEPEEQKPMTADAIEGEVANADRTDQLRHPNREDDVEVRVSEEDTEGDGPEDYEERRDLYREEAEEAAEAYYNSRTPEEQDELEDIHEEAESVRRFEGKEKTDDFDLSAALGRVRENRESRQSKRDAEEAEMEEDFDAEQEWSEDAGFFDEMFSEQEDPAAVDEL